MNVRLILASSSIFRRELLSRLQLPFECISPALDESRLNNESPMQLAQRLARQKAEAVALQLPNGEPAIVIGSDQVAYCEPNLLGKPLTRERAIEQLIGFSGRAVLFHTALCVLRANHAGQTTRFEHLDTTTVRFRTLDRAEIEAYVDAEDVLHCAGSFKSEGLGITLFDAIESTDPTALIGLPMIAVARALRTLETKQ